MEKESRSKNRTCLIVNYHKTPVIYRHIFMAVGTGHFSDKKAMLLQKITVNVYNSGCGDRTKGDSSSSVARFVNTLNFILRRCNVRETAYFTLVI